MLFCEAGICQEKKLDVQCLLRTVCNAVELPHHQPHWHSTFFACLFVSCRILHLSTLLFFCVTKSLSNSIILIMCKWSLRVVGKDYKKKVIDCCPLCLLIYFTDMIKEIEILGFFSLFFQWFAFLWGKELRKFTISQKCCQKLLPDARLVGEKGKSAVGTPCFGSSKLNSIYA